MSILFDDASTQYATAVSPAVAFPFALACWLYIDDLDIDQTFAAIQDASSEDNYYRIGLKARVPEITDVTTVPNNLAEVTDITTVADVSRSLENTHFTIESPTTSYYVWFSIDSSSVDPAPGGTGIEVVIVEDDTADAVASALQLALDAEGDFGASVVSDVVTVTNVDVGSVTDANNVDAGFTFNVTTQGISNALDGTHFTIDFPTTSYYVWFSVDSASVDPTPGGTGIEVSVFGVDSADAVAAALQAVLDAEGDFGASVISDVVTVTNATHGSVTDAVDVDTGFSLNVTQQGTDDSILQGEIVDNASVSELAEATAPLSVNTWHHALVIFNTATDIRVRLDGLNEGVSPGGSAVAPTGIDTLSIGRNGKLTPEGYTSGRIAELVMWNLSTLLSEGEINDVAIDKLNPVLTRTDELLYYAPIYNNDDPIIDIMAHLNATLSNAPATANHPPIQMFEPETFMRFRSGPIEFDLNPENTLQFTHIANWELVKSVSSSLGFNQKVQHNVIWIRLAHNIGFTQGIVKNTILEISIEHTLFFSQQQGPTTEESLSDSIGFTHQAARAGDPRSTIEFQHQVDVEASTGAKNSIEFQHQVDVNQEATKSLADGIQFNHAVVAWKDDDACARQEYNPQGAGMPAIVIGVASEITLVCGADSITLRNPDFNNSESVDVDRALNISRGGTPKLIRDSQWPKQTTHIISISVMTRDKALELLDFLKNCLGLLVTYTDHEERVWEGIITNPDSVVVDGGNDCKYNATLELQSTLVP